MRKLIWVFAILLLSCGNGTEPAQDIACDTYTFSAVVSEKPDTLIPNPDVIVIIRDNNGKELIDTTDANGNFSITSEACLPFVAELRKGNNSMSMISKRTETNCAVCHTPDGQAGGYIYISP